MRVLFLQRQPCVRALKYATALGAVAPSVALGFAFQGKSLSEWYGSGDELFDLHWRLGRDVSASLAAVIDEFQPDLVHSHNLPDSLTVAALEVVDGGIPVIHDCHDLQSLRNTPYEDGLPEPIDALELEKRAIEGASALVTVSPEMLAEVSARYALPAVACHFPNFALERYLPADLPPARSSTGPPRIVYQGTLSTNGGHYDLRDIFSSLVADGSTLDIFPGRPVPAYVDMAQRTTGIRCHATLDPGELYRTLPRFDFGWAGFNAALNPRHLDTALPNKAFEYVACGLPVLTLGHAALTRLIAEYGVGVSLRTPWGLRRQLEEVDLAAIRRRLEKVRFELTMEANIGRILELYEAVASG
jgi:glycosyltransferase involved in cell wall biosynthesis